MKNEIERRWLHPSLDKSVLPERCVGRFKQGYFDTKPGVSLRVRIIDMTSAKMTHKRGKGLSRPETEVEIPIESALELYEHACQDRLEKTRFRIGRFEIDLFHGPLAGLVVVECEYEHEGEDVPLPDWMEGAVEVTDSINNLTLAKLATVLGDERPAKSLRDYLPSPIPMIVLTGGPGSGKTTAIERLKQELGGTVKFVPEAATILISQVGIIPPGDDPVGMARFQQTILRVQHAFEEAAVDQAVREGKKAVVLDRGSLDNAAYLPHGVSDFERICGVKADDEAKRYTRVICLLQPPADVYDRIKNNNPARRETSREAEQLGRSILSAWASAGNNFLFAGNDNWEKKYEQVRKYLLESIPD